MLVGEAWTADTGPMLMAAIVICGLTLNGVGVDPQIHGLPDSDYLVLPWRPVLLCHGC